MSMSTTPRPTEAPVRLHPLTYVPEGDEVMVGRPDTGSYGVFPPAGARALRSLAAGTSVAVVAEQWRRETGESFDLDEFTELMDDLGFLVHAGEEPAVAKPVRWQRLGRWLFAPASWVLYGVILLAAVIAMIIDPGLRPTYHHFFFTEHITLIPILLTVGQIPLVILHEAYHALAARRLGLPSQLAFGRRFFYLVVETRLDALYSVPRRQRYLPIVAGSVIDLVVIAAFTLAAAGIRLADGPDWLAGMALAFALAGLLRALWQGLFYLETDVYFAVNAASGCTDLHGAASYRLRGWWARIRRRPADPANGAADDWSEHDHTAAKWYAPLMILGYGLSLFTLLWVGLPTSITFWTTIGRRLFGPDPVTLPTILDTAFFVVFTASQLGLLIYVAIRDWRAKRRIAVSPSAEPERESS